MNTDKQVQPFDFFISYTTADRVWAEWIRWQLQQENHSVMPLDQGLRTDRTFELEVSEILKSAKSILVILSPEYLYMLYFQLGWALIFKEVMSNKENLILPIQIRECKHALKSIMGPIEFVDLVGMDELKARKSLLAQIHQHSPNPISEQDALSPAHDETQRAILKKQLTFFRQHGVDVDWEDTNLFRINATSPVIGNIPTFHTPFFTDREEILERLHLTFTATDLPTPQALTGLEGIGKTEIALEYAHRYVSDYDYLLWVESGSQEWDESSSREQDEPGLQGHLASRFVALAEVLRLPERHKREQDKVVEAVKQWLQDNYRWLLILDNVEDPSVISNFIPINSRGHILLTTRMQAPGTIAQCVRVPKLSPADGATLLLRRIGAIGMDMTLDDASATERLIAEDISQQMDGLPLALDQAGAYIEETRLGLSYYRDSYVLLRQKSLEQRGNASTTHRESVTNTWRMSLTKVEEANLAAIELMKFCAFFTIDALPEELLNKNTDLLGPVLGPVASDVFQLNRAIEVLRRFSFIARDPHNKTLHIHKLLKEVIVDTMSLAERQLWAERAVEAVNHVFPTGIYDHRGACQKYIDCAMSCKLLIEKWNITSPEASRLLYESANYLLLRGWYRDAFLFHQKALDLRERSTNRDDAAIASSANDLGWVYRTFSQYAESRTLFLRALDLRVSQLREHTQTRNDLGWLAYNQGKYDETEKLYSEVLSIRQKILDPDDPDLATSYNNLAWIYYVQGRYKEAEPLYQLALKIREQRLPEGHPYIATCIDNLGRLARARGRYKEAEEFYKRALELREKALGDEHPDVASSLSGLGVLYYATGQYEPAEQCYLRALAIRRDALGPDHPHVARIQTNLGRLYRSQGKYEWAEQSYTNALTTQEARLGLSHPDVAQTLNHLARLYRNLARYDESEQLYDRALSIRRQTFGSENHPDVAETINNRGRLYFVEGRYDEAEQAYLLALNIREETLGEDHPNVAQTLNNLARLYCVLGRYVEAEQLGGRAYAIWKEKLGTQHRYAAVILNNLGMVYMAQQRYAWAEQLYQQAWDVGTGILGKSHPDIVFTMNNLADIARFNGRFQQAEVLLLQAIELRQQKLGEEHPFLAYSHEILAEVYSQQGRFDRAATSLDLALALHKKGLSPDHPDIATSLHKRADLYVAQEAYNKAETLYLQALAIREKKLGPHHHDVALTLHGLAKLYELQGKHALAETYYQRAISVYEQIHEPGVIDKILTLEHFSAFLRKLGRETEVMEMARKIDTLRRTRMPHATFPRFLNRDIEE